MDWVELIQGWGPAGAAVCGMGYITHRFLVFLGNHLSRNTDALNHAAETLARLTEAVRECPKRGE